MQSISIQIPAKLFVKVYEIYGENWSDKLNKVLQELVDSGKEDYVWKSMRPKEGTITGRVWDIADEYKKTTGGKVSREAIVKKCVEEGINMNTANTQYSYWIKEQL